MRTFERFLIQVLALLPTIWLGFSIRAESTVTNNTSQAASGASVGGVGWASSTNSDFRIVGLPVRTTNGGWRIQWASTAGNSYRLQRWNSTDLGIIGNPRWIDVAEVSASNKLSVAEDPNPPAVPKNFYRVVQFVVDSTPPTISGLTANPASIDAQGVVTLTVVAQDNVGVSSVTFFDGSTALGTGTRVENDRWRFFWPVGASLNGVHSIGARAADGSGNTASATAISFRAGVTNHLIDITVGVVHIQAEAATTNGTVITATGNAWIGSISVVSNAGLSIDTGKNLVSGQGKLSIPGVGVVLDGSFTLNTTNGWLAFSPGNGVSLPQLALNPQTLLQARSLSLNVLTNMLSGVGAIDVQVPSQTLGAAHFDGTFTYDPASYTASVQGQLSLERFTGSGTATIQLRDTTFVFTGNVNLAVDINKVWSLTNGYLAVVIETNGLPHFDAHGTLRIPDVTSISITGQVSSAGAISLTGSTSGQVGPFAFDPIQATLARPANTNLATLTFNGNLHHQVATNFAFQGLVETTGDFDFTGDGRVDVGGFAFDPMHLEMMRNASTTNKVLLHATGTYQQTDLNPIPFDGYFYEDGTVKLDGSLGTYTLFKYATASSVFHIVRTNNVARFTLQSVLNAPRVPPLNLMGELKSDGSFDGMATAQQTNSLWGYLVRGLACELTRGTNKTVTLSVADSQLAVDGLGNKAGVVHSASGQVNPDGSGSITFTDKNTLYGYATSSGIYTLSRSTNAVESLSAQVTFSVAGLPPLTLGGTIAPDGTPNLSTALSSPLLLTQGIFRQISTGSTVRIQSDRVMVFDGQTILFLEGLGYFTATMMSTPGVPGGMVPIQTYNLAIETVKLGNVVIDWGAGTVNATLTSSQLILPAGGRLLYNGNPLTGLSLPQIAMDLANDLAFTVGPLSSPTVMDFNLAGYGIKTPTITLNRVSSTMAQIILGGDLSVLGLPSPMGVHLSGTLDSATYSLSGRATNGLSIADLPISPIAAGALFNLDPSGLAASVCLTNEILTLLHIAAPPVAQIAISTNASIISLTCPALVTPPIGIGCFSIGLSGGSNVLATLKKNAISFPSGLQFSVGDLISPITLPAFDCDGTGKLLFNGISQSLPLSLPSFNTPNVGFLFTNIQASLTCALKGNSGLALQSMAFSPPGSFPTVQFSGAVRPWMEFGLTNIVQQNIDVFGFQTTMTNVMYNSPIAGYAWVLTNDNPMAYYRLDKNEYAGQSGSSTVDYSMVVPWISYLASTVDYAPGKSHSFRFPINPITGQPTFTRTGMGALAEINGSYIFTGNQPLLLTNSSFPKSDFDLTGPMAVEFWVRPTDFAKPDETYISKGDSGWRLGRHGSFSRKISFESGAVGSSNYNQLLSTHDLDVAGWHHIVAMYDGTNKFLYFDGQLDNAAPSPKIPSNNANAAIGGVEDNALVTANAGLDEVAFYAHTLTGGRIAAHYATGMGFQMSTLATVSLPGWSLTWGGTLARNGSDILLTGVLTNRATPPALKIGTIEPGARVVQQDKQIALSGTLGGSFVQLLGLSSAPSVTVRVSLPDTIAVDGNLTLASLPSLDFKAFRIEFPAGGTATWAPDHIDFPSGARLVLTHLGNASISLPNFSLKWDGTLGDGAGNPGLPVTFDNLNISGLPFGSVTLSLTGKLGDAANSFISVLSSQLALPNLPPLNFSGNIDTTGLPNLTNAISSTFWGFAGQVNAFIGSLRDYAGAVKASSPEAYWRLGDKYESNPNTPLTPSYWVRDEMGRHDAYIAASPTNVNPIVQNEPGALQYDSNGSFRFGSGGLTSNQFISIPASAGLNLNNGPMTLEAWIKIRQTGATSTILVGKGDLSRDPQFGLTNVFYGLVHDATSSTNDILEFLAEDDGYPGVEYLSVMQGPPAIASAWHHVVCVFDPVFLGGRVQSFVDGMLSADDQTSGAAALLTTALPLTIGQSVDSKTTHFDGWIDEVAVYNRSVNPLETARHYMAAGGPGVLAAQINLNLPGFDSPVPFTGSVASDGSVRAFYSGLGVMNFGGFTFTNVALDLIKNGLGTNVNFRGQLVLPAIGGVSGTLSMGGWIKPGGFEIDGTNTAALNLAGLPVATINANSQFTLNQAGTLTIRAHLGGGLINTLGLSSALPDPVVMTISPSGVVNLLQSLQLTAQQIGRFKFNPPSGLGAFAATLKSQELVLPAGGIFNYQTLPGGAWNEIILSQSGSSFAMPAIHFAADGGFSLSVAASTPPKMVIGGFIITNANLTISRTAGASAVLSTANPVFGHNTNNYLRVPGSGKAGEILAVVQVSGSIDSAGNVSLSGKTDASLSFGGLPFTAMAAAATASLEASPTKFQVGLDGTMSGALVDRLKTLIPGIPTSGHLDIDSNGSQLLSGSLSLPASLQLISSGDVALSFPKTPGVARWSNSGLTFPSAGSLYESQYIPASVTLPSWTLMTDSSFSIALPAFAPGRILGFSFVNASNVVFNGTLDGAFSLSPFEASMSLPQIGQFVFDGQVDSTGAVTLTNIVTGGNFCGFNVAMTNALLFSSNLFASSVQSLAPLAWWRLGDKPVNPTISGYTIKDERGTNSTTTGLWLVGNNLMVLGEQGALRGDSNTSVRFGYGTNASSAYVIIPNKTAPGSTAHYFDLTNQMSLQVWLKTDGQFTKGWQGIVTKGDSSWRLHRMGTTRKVSFGTSHATMQYHDLSSVSDIDDGQWHFIVCTFNSGVKSLYVDGVLEATATVPALISTNNYTVCIGANSEMSGREFKGWISDVSIYNYALNPQLPPLEYFYGGGAMMYSQATLQSVGMDSVHFTGWANSIGDVRLTGSGDSIYAGNLKLNGANYTFARDASTGNAAVSISGRMTTVGFPSFSTPPGISPVRSVTTFSAGGSAVGTLTYNYAQSRGHLVLALANQAVNILGYPFNLPNLTIDTDTGSLSPVSWSGTLDTGLMGLPGWAGLLPQLSGTLDANNVYFTPVTLPSFLPIGGFGGLSGFPAPTLQFSRDKGLYLSEKLDLYVDTAALGTVDFGDATLAGTVNITGANLSLAGSANVNLPGGITVSAPSIVMTSKGLFPSAANVFPTLNLGSLGLPATGFSITTNGSTMSASWSGSESFGSYYLSGSASVSFNVSCDSQGDISGTAKVSASVTGLGSKVLGAWDTEPLTPVTVPIDSSGLVTVNFGGIVFFVPVFDSHGVLTGWNSASSISFNLW